LPLPNSFKGLLSKCKLVAEDSPSRLIGLFSKYVYPLLTEHLASWLVW
jgi:hypothetical protein